MHDTGFSVFRVLADFKWYGWQYTPSIHQPCECGHKFHGCSERPWSGCLVCEERLRCFCSCKKEPGLLGGDILVVEERHPMLIGLIWGRMVAYDISLGLYLTKPLERKNPSLSLLKSPANGLAVQRQRLYRL